MQTEPSPERLRKLLEFLQRDPDNLSLRKDAIRLAHDTRSWKIADELLAAGLTAQPLDPALHALLGYSHLQARRYADAERELWAALSLGIEPAEVRYNLALSMFMQQRYADALEYLNAPLLPFELPLVSMLRARCLHRLQRLEEALASCEQYLLHVGPDAEGQGLMSLLCYDTGQADRAQRYAEAAVELHDMQLEARVVLASLQLDRRDLRSAQQLFQAVLSIDSACGRARLGLALIALDEMKLDVARREAELAARAMPDHVGTWHVIAWTALLQGDLSEAARAFHEAIALDRNFAESHGGLALIAAIEGRREEASDSIKRALRLDPSSLSPRYAQIVLLQREGRHREAQDILSDVLARTGGGELSYRDALARQIQRLGMHSHNKASRLVH